MKEVENMSADELAVLLPAWEKEADEYQRKADALRQIIAGVRALNGDAPAIFARSFESHRTIFELGPHDVPGPRGRAAVLEIMSEDPARVWKVVDLKREMLRRGWAPTPKAVEASIKRLRELEEIESAGYGFYRLVSGEPEDRNDSGDEQEVRSGESPTLDAA